MHPSKKVTKLSNFPKADSKKINDAIEAARQNAETIPEFFEKYAEILAKYDVIIDFTSYPYDYRDESSSHDSPIGRPRAWTKEQRDDPNIPNTYPAYAGEIVGTITNNSNFVNRIVESHRLFWAFGDFDKEWIHAKPGNGRWNDNVETFSLPIYLFIEDFPLIYQGRRKQITINEMNDRLDVALDLYDDQMKENRNSAISSDIILAEISDYTKEVNMLLKKLSAAASARRNHVANEVNKTKLAIPKIESPYLNLGRYQKTIEAHKVVELPEADYTDIYEKLKNIDNDFSDYVNNHTEDFL